MTSSFHGKWTVYSPNAKKYMGYFVSHPLLCMRPGPPGKETIVVFVLRSAKELCFFLQHGQYVGPGPTTFALEDERGRAGIFDFPDHDYNNLPASFTSKIHSAVDNSYLFDVESNVFAEKNEHLARVFTITQHTPTLEQIQASKKGDGLDLAGVDLSGGTLDNVSLVAADFSHSNLNNVKLTNCTLTKALLNNCIMLQADLSGSNLSGANLNDVDLTGVVIGAALPHFCTNPDQAPSPADPRPTFLKSKLNQSLLGTEWSKLDLRGTTILNLPSPLSSKDKPLAAKHSILTGLNQNNLSNLSLQFANFDYAVLDSVNLDGCDLTNASFKQASMHETVLSDATLKNAKMIGAQLGSLSQLFSLPAGYETHLNAGAVDAALRDQFVQHGITLSDSATVNAPAPGRVWQLNDSGHNINYTIRLEGDLSRVLTVYKPGVAASLINAYMPDAVLTQANLYGVLASGVQFYGSNARIDGAILEKIEFNDANLSTVNFTQAQMMGAILSNSHLFNAKFNKANLSPSADGVAANLSNANLQGADFTDAQLFGANLTNAAVAINVPTKVLPNQGGVYLFSLPCKGDTATLGQYTAELTAAAKSFILPYTGDPTTLDGYKTALNANNPNAFKIAFLKQIPRITLSTSAVIKPIEIGSVWQIVDEPHSYTLWLAIDPTVDAEHDPNKGIRLYVAPSLPNTQAGFKKSNMPLRSQASASVDTAGLQWLIDNDSENPENFSTGYVRFLLQQNGNVLDVYGVALRILRIGDKKEEEFDTETCQVTKLIHTNMSAETVCPNGATLGVNQSRSGKNWDTLWLRAAVPPKPPACVPTDYTFCPPKTRKKHEPGSE